MFPNVRLMIAVTFACGVILVCGIVGFATFRTTYEPLTRQALGGGPLPLSVEGVAATTGAGLAPFTLRFAADQPPRVPFNLSLLQLNARDPAVAWPDVSTVGPAPAEVADDGEQPAPAVTTEAVEIAAAEPLPDPPASATAPDIAPANMADAATPTPDVPIAAMPTPDPKSDPQPDSAPQPSESLVIAALPPEVAEPPAIAVEAAPPAQVPTTPEPPTADDSAAAPVADAGEAAKAAVEPVASQVADTGDAASAAVEPVPSQVADTGEAASAAIEPVASPVANAGDTANAAVEPVPSQVADTGDGANAAIEPVPAQVADAGDAASAAVEPVPSQVVDAGHAAMAETPAEPPFERIAALTPAESAIELGHDPPTIRGKVPLPRVGPPRRTARTARVHAAVAEPRTVPPAERVAALTPAESAIEPGHDPPTIRGKVPLPRVGPPRQTARPAGVQAEKKPAIKPPTPVVRVAKAHRVRHARSRAVAFGSGQDPFAIPSAFQTQPNFQSQPNFQTQFPATAPMGGPFVGANQWPR